MNHLDQFHPLYLPEEYDCPTRPALHKIYFYEYYLKTVLFYNEIAKETNAMKDVAGIVH